MQFYMTGEDASRIQLPINPEQVTAQTGTFSQTFRVIERGEIVLPRGKVPARLAWDGILPGAERQGAVFVTAWQPPAVILDQLQRWRDQAAKVRLLVTETPLNLDVYIDTLEHTWGGGHGDCRYRLQLVQARVLQVLPEGSAAQPTLVAAPPRPTPPAPKQYTVKPGDTLWGIAKQTLSTGDRWRELYEANRSTIGPDPNTIRVGQVLRIPGSQGVVA